jgi:predicted regulator of Ras-like GTPase activity (Roadblock/LC7/MglB family)
MILGLETLAATSGVRGVAVFDSKGRAIGEVLSPPYEANFLSQVLHRLRVAIDVCASLEEGELSTATVFGDAGGLIVRQVGSNTIVVLVELNVNLNLLNVAMGVVSTNLQRLSPSALPESGTMKVQPLQSQLGMQSHTASTASHTFTSSGGAAGEIPPDAVDRLHILRLLEVYRTFMGPMAKTVLKQELESLGASSRTLRQGQYPDLIGRLARRIPSSDRRVEFSAMVAKVS